MFENKSKELLKQLSKEEKPIQDSLPFTIQFRELKCHYCNELIEEGDTVCYAHFGDFIKTRGVVHKKCCKRNNKKFNV